MTPCHLRSSSSPIPRHWTLPRIPNTRTHNLEDKMRTIRTTHKWVEGFFFSVCVLFRSSCHVFSFRPLSMQRQFGTLLYDTASCGDSGRTNMHTTIQDHQYCGFSTHEIRQLPPRMNVLSSTRTAKDAGVVVPRPAAEVGGSIYVKMPFARACDGN